MIDVNGLMVLRAVAETEYQLKEQQKDLEAMRAFKDLEVSTQHFCDETVTPALIAKANARKRLSYSFKAEIFKDRLGNRIAYLIVPCDYRYRDGTQVFAVDKNQEIALQYLNNLCANAGYALSEHESSCLCWARGKVECTEITIDAGV